LIFYLFISCFSGHNLPTTNARSQPGALNMRIFAQIEKKLHLGLGPRVQWRGPKKT